MYQVRPLKLRIYSLLETLQHCICLWRGTLNCWDVAHEAEAHEAKGVNGSTRLVSNARVDAALAIWGQINKATLQ